MAEIPDAARQVLDKKAIAHVATLMEDGSPQVTPVWVNVDDGEVLINTAVGRLKDKNLRRDPRIALSVTDPDDAYSPVLIRGRVTEITEEGADEHADLLAKKYLDVDEYPFRQEGEVRLTVRIEPDQVSVGQG